MKPNFFDRLYDGFKAEYFVMGELFGAGYEGFKLPADFGFDVLATNQKESSLGVAPEGRTVVPPYALQVKSRNISHKSFGDGPSGRRQAVLDYWITVRDFELIRAEQSGYLVCVISVAGVDSELSGRNLFFWLHSSHLPILKERGYFLALTPPFEHTQPYLRLRVCVRLLPTNDASSLIEKLRADGHITEVGERTLRESLPAKLATTWRSAEYVSLMRPSKTNTSDEVVRQIPHQMITFANLGKAIALGSLD